MNPKERADGKPSAFDMQRLTAGDTIEGVISDFGMNGEGVLKVGAYPVFVPFAIVGEKEVNEGTVSVRREGVDQGSMPADKFVEYIKSAIADELKD